MSRAARCEDVRDALLSGEPASEPALLVHAETCDQCATLLLDQATLGRALAAPREASSGEELWSTIEQRVRAEASPRGWLRSRSTGVRTGLALAGVLVVVLLGAGHLRADWSSLPSLAMLAWLAVFVGAALGLVALSLRALGRAEATPGRRRGWLVAALALPLAYSLTASSLLDHEETGASGAWLLQAVACFVYGVLLSLPLIALLWLLDRGAGPRSRVLAAGGAIGLAANGALLLHCGTSDPAHLVLGHVTIGGALALAGWLLSRGRLSVTGSTNHLTRTGPM